MTAMWKTPGGGVSHMALENPSGFPHSHSPDGVFINKKSVTYVSEHLLPMSPVKTPGGRGLRPETFFQNR
jgi:hypothetical protein